MCSNKIYDWFTNVSYFKNNSVFFSNSDLANSMYMLYLTLNTLAYVFTKVSLRRNFYKNKMRLWRVDFFCKGSHSSTNSQVISSGTECLNKQVCVTSQTSKEISMNVDEVLVCEKDRIRIKKHPNYFIAVQITNDQVHSSVKQIQEHILFKNILLEKFMISRNTLHVTLMVLHLQDCEDHSKAIKALKEVQQEYRSCEKEPLNLEFCGVGHFQNKVIFAKIKKNESYMRLCELVKNIHFHFGRVGLQSTDTRTEFTPHLTIAKIKYSKNIPKKCKKILPSLYQDFINLYFGCNPVESLQLLKMHGPKTSAGYYVGDEVFLDCNDQVLLKKLNSVYSIAEKKKAIKNKVSSITKKLKT